MKKNENHSQPNQFQESPELQQNLGQVRVFLELQVRTQQNTTETTRTKPKLKHKQNLQSFQSPTSFLFLVLRDLYG